MASDCTEDDRLSEPSAPCDPLRAKEPSVCGKEPSFALYLHVPFCVAKCGYCSFYSRVTDESAVEGWLAGVSREAGRLAALWGGPLPLETAYVGGGTPSTLSLAVWKRLLHVLEDAFRFSETVEATVEANPHSLTDGHLALWRGFFTRVSLGVQSLQDGELAWLGRRHGADDALRALEKILSRGFDASADLLFSLPAQTLRAWHDSLRRTAAAGAGHISTYQLTPEPGTPLGNAAPALPDGYPFYRFAQWYLERKGMEQYEIASFSLPGKECRHNLAYWRQGNVLGLGPSAWGYLDGFRYRNAPSLEEYVPATEARFPAAGAERLEGRARGVEAAILALRTKWGVELAPFSARFGQKLTDDLLEALRGVPPRLVRFEKASVRLTPPGMRVGNAIWSGLLSLAE
ncbi:MAG: radical SAM family heme chaperone HemW [Synergistaceae bacterium]|jgi:oxygen-independent coproporphyrinogen-3 oxidase|nr:radical SAM family heme chaperone HemW [Synergistaceae bacterium]